MRRAAWRIHQRKRPWNPFSESPSSIVTQTKRGKSAIYCPFSAFAHRLTISGQCTRRNSTGFQFSLASCSRYANCRSINSHQNSHQTILASPISGGQFSLISLFCWCREGGSNPHDRKGRRILSPLRLPVPPSRHGVGFQEKYRIYVDYGLVEATRQSSQAKRTELTPARRGACNPARPRDSPACSAAVSQRIFGRKSFLSASRGTAP